MYDSFLLLQVMLIKIHVPITEKGCEAPGSSVGVVAAARVPEGFI